MSGMVLGAARTGHVGRARPVVPVAVKPVQVVPDAQPDGEPGLDFSAAPAPDAQPQPPAQAVDSVDNGGDTGGPDGGVEAAAQPEPEPEPAAEPAAQAQPETVEQAKPEPEPEPAAQAKPETEPEPAAAQPETVAEPAGQAKSVKSRSRKQRSRTAGKTATKTAGDKTLVIVEDGAVTYADTTVHVLDLDSINGADLDIAVQALTGLADVADSDGKARAVDTLLARVKELTVG